MIGMRHRTEVFWGQSYPGEQMSWLKQQVRQTRLLHVALGVGAIAAVGAGIALNQRYFENLRAGPYAIPLSELVATQSADDLARYWVSLRPAQLLDTGVDHLSVRKRYGVETGRSVTGHFWVAVVGDRLLFVETSGAAPLANQAITGKLVDTPHNVSNHLMQGVNPVVKAKVLPIMLKTGDFAAPAYIGLSAAAAISGIALMWALVAGVRALSPGNHRALRALQAASISLDEAGHSITEDMRTGSSLQVGTYRLTREYLVRTGLIFDLRELKDLLWVYPIVVSHKMYGFIPTGKSHQLALHFPDKKLTLKIAKNSVERIAQALATVSPWTIIGHSPDLEHAWSKQRAQLVSFIAGRRAQVLAHWAQGSTAAPGSA